MKKVVLSQPQYPFSGLTHSPAHPRYLRSLQASQAHDVSEGSGWVPRASLPLPASAGDPPRGP